MPVAKRKTRTLTKTQRLAREERIIKDLRAGKLSYRQIAAKRKVSLPTVNAKARKAGISRSRSGPASTRRAVRPVKATSRARTRITARAKSRTTARAKTRTTIRKRTPRKITRRAISTPRTTRFENRFRELVMNYYPNMPLRTFERLTKMVNKVIK